MSAVEPTPAPHRPRIGWMSAVTTTAFFISAVVLAILTWNGAAARRATQQELDSARRSRDKLQAFVSRLEADWREMERDRRTILDVMSHCLNAEDVPDLHCDRIVARSEGIERLCFYVPAGSHTLEIVARWSARSAAASTSDRAAKSADQGESSWRVPLLPASGYFLSVTTDRQKKQVAWNLSGNHPDFVRRSEMVPLGEFHHQGSSWSSLKGIHLPNQIGLASSTRTAEAVQNPPPIKLADAQFFGSRAGVPSIVEITVQLASDGPAQVTATDANRILRQGKGDFALTYAGGGKYVVRAK